MQKALIELKNKGGSLVIEYKIDNEKRALALKYYNDKFQVENNGFCTIEPFEDEQDVMSYFGVDFIEVTSIQKGE